MTNLEDISLIGVNRIIPLDIEKAYLDQRYDIEAILRYLQKSQAPLQFKKPVLAKEWLENDPSWAVDLKDSAPENGTQLRLLKYYKYSMIL